MGLRALVLGSTGLVGGRATNHLATDARYDHVVCLVRKATGRQAGKVEDKVVDFDALADVPAVDDVFCALGTTMKKAGSKEAFRKVDHDIPLDVARRAREAGATRFVLVSSVGADPTSSNFYLKTKGELESALERLGFASLSILRPSFLVGDRAESRPGEAVGVVLARGLGGLMLGGLRKYRPIDVDEVGRAMVAAARREPPNRAIFEHDAIRALACEIT